MDEKKGMGGEMVIVFIMAFIMLTAVWLAVFPKIIFYEAKAYIFLTQKFSPHQDELYNKSKNIDNMLVNYHPFLTNKILKLDIKREWPKDLIALDHIKDKGYVNTSYMAEILKQIYMFNLLLITVFSGLYWYKYDKLSKSFFFKSMRDPYQKAKTHGAKLIEYLYEYERPYKKLLPLAKKVVNDQIVSHYHLPPFLLNSKSNADGIECFDYAKRSYEMSMLILDVEYMKKAAELRKIQYIRYLLQEEMFKEEIKTYKDENGDPLNLNSEIDNILHHFRKECQLPYSRYHTDNYDISGKEALLKNLNRLGNLMIEPAEYDMIRNYVMIKRFWKVGTLFNKNKLRMPKEEPLYINYLDNMMIKKEINEKGYDIPLKPILEEPEKIQALLDKYKIFVNMGLEEERIVIPEYYILHKKQDMRLEINSEKLLKTLEEYVSKFTVPGFEILFNILKEDLFTDVLGAMYLEIKELEEEKQKKINEHEDEDIIKNYDILIVQKKNILDSLSGKGLEQRLVNIFNTHQFEETIVLALFIFTKSIKNISYGLHSQLKVRNAVFWFAITSIGRPSIYKAGLPIWLTYNIENEQFKQRYESQVNELENIQSELEDIDLEDYDEDTGYEYEDENENENENIVVHKTGLLIS